MSDSPDLNSPRFPHLQVALPTWVESFLPAADHVFETVEERMQLAIDLARRNIEQGTGGPFGAAVFDLHHGTLLAPGVNIVVTSRWSGAHAEMVAFAIAQQLAGSHDLGSEQDRHYEIVTSCEPCSMCFGATPWSGVKRLVCGATEADARAIGFDEGPKPADWVQELESRGIEVLEGIHRQQAAQVLRDYATTGGYIYNGQRGS
ncbi:nucleoside deaminase [Aeoliella sp. ICT_H6.2]|uniref:Nucleoside deaminase n=1 Tax=Aeoliella straminimaris TaxID=2954799 RepID=A0A9X2F569_9BACT|nr:nucleoside deaminase [Aeoliella straminimaris]MCO6042410.1 nucleoside deaminase [Aeoliella straminimaris]